MFLRGVGSLLSLYGVQLIHHTKLFVDGHAMKPGQHELLSNAA